MTGRAGATSASAAAASRRSATWRRRRPGETHRLPRPAHPARRHRQPGAFPRAGAGAQGRSGDGLARGGAGRRDRRLRNAQHQSADDERGRTRRQGAPRHRPHALRLRLLGRRHARERRRCRRAGAAAGRGRHQGVHGLVDRRPAGRGRRGRRLDPEEHAPPRRLPFRGRIPPARASRRTRRRRSVLASGLARRDRRAALHRAAGADRARDARAASMCCTSRPPRRSPSSRRTRMSPPARRRRII